MSLHEIPDLDLAQMADDPHCECQREAADEWTRRKTMAGVRAKTADVEPEGSLFE